MGKLKFEGFQVGDAIKAFDFQPRPSAGVGTGSFLVGTIEQVVRAGSDQFPFAHYLVRVTRDVMGGVDVSRAPRNLNLSRVGSLVAVPMQTMFDYAGRVERAA